MTEQGLAWSTAFWSEPFLLEKPSRLKAGLRTYTN